MEMNFKCEQNLGELYYNPGEILNLNINLNFG